LIAAAESEVDGFLGDADLEAAVKAASEVGDRARSSMLFRPADGWGDFERACRHALENAGSWEARLATKGNLNPRDPASAVVVQTWARGLVLLSRDLAVIRNAISETVNFAKDDLAGGESAADLSGQLNDLGNKALGYIDNITGAST
jgi:hypothetical protein